MVVDLYLWEISKILEKPFFIIIEIDCLTITQHIWNDTKWIKWYESPHLFEIDLKLDILLTAK